jgi:NAD(P)-dependent dehydrogenase (short-subunit alcohol dehydrogenase family)
VQKSIDVNVFGSFLFGQQSAKALLERGSGTILFTGASAGQNGLAQCCAFSMGKFAQRGLAQSMARELHPQNIHVCWINIDGPIRVPGRVDKIPDSMLNPDAIARTYLSIVKQQSSAWTNEISLRSWADLSWE